MPFPPPLFFPFPWKHGAIYFKNSHRISLEKENSFCLELAWASQPGLLQAIGDDVIQQLAVFSVPEVTSLHKFIVCAFRLLPATYFSHWPCCSCAAASEFFPSSSLAPFPFFVFVVGELHFTPKGTTIETKTHLVLSLLVF